MGHAREAGERVRELCDEMIASACAAALEDSDILPFVRALIAHMIRADGSMGGDELALQAGFNRDASYSLHEEAEYARFLANDNPHFLRTVPRFMLRAKDYDDRYGTRLGLQFLGLISCICAAIREIDGRTHADELENEAVLVSTLRTALDVDESL